MKKIEIIYFNSDNEITMRELRNFPDDTKDIEIDKYCRNLISYKDVNWKYVWNDFKLKIKNKVPKDRKVQIRYSTDNGEPDLFEIMRFPADTPDHEIDDYCYDVVETEFANHRWFDWHEIGEGSQSL